MLKFVLSSIHVVVRPARLHVLIAVARSASNCISTLRRVNLLAMNAVVATMNNLAAIITSRVSSSRIIPM